MAPRWIVAPQLAVAFALTCPHSAGPAPEGEHLQDPPDVAVAPLQDPPDARVTLQDPPDRA